MPAKTAATLKDVARAAGVNDATVSRACSGKAPVAVATRERVFEAAKALGYRRSGSAVAMRTGRTNCFALLLSTHGDRSVIPRLLINGVQHGMRPHDLHLAVEALPDHQLTSEGHVPKLLREVACDGLLINYNARIPRRMIELIREFHLPAIWLNSKQDSDCVYPDDHGAAVSLTQRLIELGHTRIAFVDYTHSKSETPWHYSGIDRRAGYEQTMKQAGLSPVRVGSSELRDQDAIWSSMTEFMQSDDRPTAVIGYRAIEARAAMHGALMARLVVPRDLTITCFADGIDQDVGPHITTMVVPDHQVGIVGVQTLREKVEQPDIALEPRPVPMRYEPGKTLAHAPKRNCPTKP